MRILQPLAALDSQPDTEPLLILTSIAGQRIRTASSCTVCAALSLSRLSEDRVLPAGMVESVAGVCRCIDTSSSLLTTTSASGFEAALMQGAVQVDIVRLCSRRYIWA